MTTQEIISLVATKKKIAQSYVTELQSIEDALENGADIKDLAIASDKLSENGSVYWFEASNDYWTDNDEEVVELLPMDGAKQLHFLHDEKNDIWI